MKKEYRKPQLLCEELSQEQFLCACDYHNPAFNEESHCAFDPDGLGFSLFAENWENCMFTDLPFMPDQFCIYTVESHVFSAS